MTDERLDRILKQALTPEISYSEIEIKKKVRNYNMKKIIKSGIAVAACAAVITAVGFGSDYFSFDKAGENHNSFTLTAYAAEMEADKEVPVVIKNNQSWVLGGDKSGNIDYCIETFFKCEGENIDHITYGINEGAFQIVELPDNSIIVDEKEYDGQMNTGVCGVVEDEEGNTLSTERYVTEYTVDYDAQENDSTSISICGEKNDLELYKALWPEESVSDLTAGAEAYSKLVDGVEITCTVYFNDGTSESKVITANGKVMTYEEAGIQYDKGDANTEDAFFVFHLK